MPDIWQENKNNFYWHTRTLSELTRNICKDNRFILKTSFALDRQWLEHQQKEDEPEKHSISPPSMKVVTKLKEIFLTGLLYMLMNIVLYKRHILDLFASGMGHSMLIARNTLYTHENSIFANTLSSHQGLGHPCQKISEYS